MIPLFRRTRTTSRRPRLTLNVTALEQRNLLAATTVNLPPVNLSLATIDALGQSLANLATRVDGANATTDLQNVANTLNNQINQMLSQPSHDVRLTEALLQIDVDSLAVVEQAIADLAPPSTGGTVYA